MRIEHGAQRHLDLRTGARPQGPLGGEPRVGRKHRQQRGGRVVKTGGGGELPPRVSRVVGGARERRRKGRGEVARRVRPQLQAGLVHRHEHGLTLHRAARGVAQRDGHAHALAGRRHARVGRHAHHDGIGTGIGTAPGPGPGRPVPSGVGRVDVERVAGEHGAAEVEQRRGGHGHRQRARRVGGRGEVERDAAAATALGA